MLLELSLVFQQDNLMVKLLDYRKVLYMQQRNLVGMLGSLFLKMIGQRGFLMLLDSDGRLLALPQYQNQTGLNLTGA